MSLSFDLITQRLAPASFLLLTLVGCGGSAEDSSGVSGDGGQCSGYDNEAGGQLRIEIRNERTTDIFLGRREYNCGGGVLYSVADAGGQALGTNASTCGGYCSQYIEGTYMGCPDICAMPPFVHLAPGESYTTTWDLLYLEFRELPAACNETFDEDLSCIQLRSIEPGRFTFSAVAGTSADCSFETCEGCDPLVDCPTGKLVAGEELFAESTVDLDASYGVTPAPIGEGNDDAALPAPNNPVVITFTE